MRSKALAILLATFWNIGNSQDKVVLVKGDTILSKVIEISDNQITYRYFTEPNGPLYKINKNTISKIIYESGRIESYETQLSEVDTQTKFLGANKWKYVELKDYSEVGITYNSSEIQGMERVGEVSGEGGGLTNEYAQQQAIRRIKKKAFSKGGKVVLISISTSNYFGTWNCQGVAYK